MKNLYTICMCLSFLAIISCKDEATIEVSNNVKNVKLEYISFGQDVPVAAGLLSGETAQVSIDNKMDNISFPMQEQIIFYISSGDHKVLLHTKAKYTINKDDYLRVILSDTTQVVNPANTIITDNDKDDNNENLTISHVSIREFSE